jgi:tape measure domain-containing protein
MNETEIFNFIFRGTTEFGDVQQELAKLLAIGQELRNESLRYQAEKRKERDEQKKPPYQQTKAELTQINARLGITKSLTDEVGIIQKLQNEQRILRQLRAESNNVADINKYTAALQASQKELNTLTGATDKFKGSNGFWREMQGWVTAALAVNQFTEWGKTLVKNEAYLEAQRLALRNVITSQTEYANSLAFLDRISNKYGQDITILTESYKSFIAASEESGLSLKERNRIYESIVKSGAALNLTNDQIQGSLLAVSQMFSKGNVQAEELRGQLGERLPGAFGLAAKALGVTEAKLNDMLKQGQVLAKDLLPLLATQLEKTYGDKAANNVNTLAGSQNRFTNSIKEYFGEVNKNLGITDKLAKGFNFIADNIKEIVLVVKNATTAWVAYEVVTRAVAAETTIYNFLEKAALVIKGEWILLTRGQAVAAGTLATAEIAATDAAIAMNTALTKGNVIFGAITLVVGVAITAIQLYESELKKAQEEQQKLNKSIGEAIAPMRLEQEAFNSLAKSVLNNNLSVEERTRALDELKKRYPDNLKGISDLKEAEQKLSTVIRNTNADFLIRSKLLENEVRESINRERATVFITKQIELEQKLANTRKAIASDISSGTLKVLKASEANLIQQLESTKAIVAKFAKANSNIEEQNNNITKNLKYNYDEQVKTVTDGEGKKNKEKIDSAKTLALLEEKSNNDALERTRRTEQESLRLQKEIDIQRINDSKASAAKKAAERLKIEAKYFSDSSQLTNKYDAEEQKDANKRVDNLLKIEKKFEDGIQKGFDNRLKSESKNYKELEALDKKAATSYIKLEESKNELVEKLRVLDLIANAKNAKEVTQIQREEEEKRLKQLKEHYALALRLSQTRLEQTKEQYGEDSKEYKQQRALVIGYEQSFVSTAIALAELLTEKQKKQYDKRKQDAKDAFDYIAMTVESFSNLLEKSIDQTLDNTGDLVLKAQAENARQSLGILKGAISATGRFISGDIVGGIFATFDTLVNAFDSIGTHAQRVAEARMQEAIRLLNIYLEEVEQDIDAIISKYDTLKEFFNLGDVQLPDFTPGFQATFDAQVAIGEKIIDNYEKAVNEENKLYDQTISNIDKKYDTLNKKEEDYHNKQVKGINDAYDAEVRRINEKYDLLNEKANQQYNAETLAIMQQGSIQLEALIKNEDSLNSVRTEYAQKRQNILNTFALADKQLNENSTQAEIDAVNAAINARDAALAKLQGWYNEELTFIVNSEGQKRKEYSATEKIQLQIQENLGNAAIKYQADEIQRAQERSTELADAEKSKNLLLETEEARYQSVITQINANALAERQTAEAKHNQILVDLDAKKNTEIAINNGILTWLLEQEAAAIGDALANSAAKGTDAYRQLENQLRVINTLLDQIRNGGGTVPVPNLPTVPPFEPIVVPRFFSGTERLPNYSGKSGIDTENVNLHVGERVLPTKLNDMLKAKFGKDIKNTDLVNLAMANYTAIDYARLASVGMSVSSTDPKLTKAIEGLSNKLGNIKQLNVSLSKSGVSLEERTGNRIIRRKQ